MVTISGFPIGITDIAFATGSYVLDLAELAERHDIDVNKYYVGIGQQKMSVTAADEDIVTMAATAAKKIVDRHGTDNISTVLFATESGVDQSKAAGIYLKSLLGLSHNIRVVELKQACYSATAAIQFALGVVARNSDEQVLVVASDIARYEQDSSGEPTQGAGAIAMLISAQPDLIALEPATGMYTDDVMDFWRPNYSSTAIVDGKFSIRAYITSLEESFIDFRNSGGNALHEIDYFCYHQPFTKMASKAHRQLHNANGSDLDSQAQAAQIEPTFIYNKIIGNSYTASIYIGLLSLLDWSATENVDLTLKRIGFFSYGSGSVGEFFTGIVQPGYREQLRVRENIQELSDRTEIDWQQYNDLYHFALPEDGSQFVIQQESHSPFRLQEVQNHMRIYGPVALPHHDA